MYKTYRNVLFTDFAESKEIQFLPIAEPFHESVGIVDVCNDVLVCHKSSLNKPGQLFAVKMHSENGVYDFTNIALNEISPSRSLPNCDNFVVEHCNSLHGKISKIIAKS